MSEQSKRIRAVVHGRVQGVYFRQTTCQQAEILGLSGWVRNMANGTVETEFQGEDEAVARMLDWLAQGPSFSTVTLVENWEKDPVSGETEFVITW
jgi:acylphosphatase